MFLCRNNEAAKREEMEGWEERRLRSATRKQRGKNENKIKFGLRRQEIKEEGIEKLKEGKETDMLNAPLRQKLLKFDNMKKKCDKNEVISELVEQTRSLTLQGLWCWKFIPKLASSER